ncbi:MAG TPA: hypothetical protein VH593_14365 [Ktedonobacteraceae bacterium]
MPTARSIVATSRAIIDAVSQLFEPEAIEDENSINDDDDEEEGNDASQLKG